MKAVSWQLPPLGAGGALCACASGELESDADAPRELELDAIAPREADRR
jgi:hypothetical protein